MSANLLELRTVSSRTALTGSWLEFMNIDAKGSSLYPSIFALPDFPLCLRCGTELTGLTEITERTLQKNFWCENRISRLC